MCCFPLTRLRLPASTFSHSHVLLLSLLLLQVLWLLSFDDKNTLADAVDKYCIGVPPIQWLAWIPQLLTCLVGSEGKPLLNLISQVRPFSKIQSPKQISIPIELKPNPSAL